MNKELRAAIKAQVEARQALNALPEEAKDEDRTAAIKALNDADQKVVELLSKEPQPAPRELRSRIALGRYLTFAAEERAIDGAEAELNKELKLKDGVVPLEALEPLAEERADAISPQDSAGDALDSGDINHTTGPMLTRVFTQTDAAFLGVAMPTVPPGERGYPVMTDGTTASMQARGAGPDAGAAKFTIVNATPKRLTGRYVFDLEGVAELGGLLESTLRSDLRAEMGWQLDNQILNGSGAAPNVTGLLSALDIDLPPGDPAGKDGAVRTWANNRQSIYGSLEGKHARMESDIRLLIGGTMYDQARALYRNANAGDAQDSIAAMRALGATIRRSFMIPAPAVLRIHGQSADSTKKHERALLNAEPGAAVAPVWQGITLIRDPYSNAKNAQVVLTAHMLYDFILRRKDGWKQYAYRTEA